ncbi:MAG: hypothetical protein H6742_20815 [Alphaproteobacteria bacterium]|nr:hypothetical protein [Alphaproteobacteria bacterium]
MSDLRLLPLGPFPPWGRALPADGVLDLGALLRDQLLARGVLSGPARQALQARFAQALEAGDLPRAADLLGLWLDTWPLAAAIEQARAEWTAAPSAEALAIIERAAACVLDGFGWRRIPGTPWPCPPDEWIVAQTEGRTVRLSGRGEADGAVLVSAALGVPVSGEEDPGLPVVRSVDGLALVGERSALARALVTGEAAAVRLTSPPPPSPAAALALGELRMEGPHQRAYERWGPAGLRVEGEAHWEELLEDADAGEAGAVLMPLAEGLLAPGPASALRRGRVDTVGFLLWDAPFRPVAVHPVAVHVLRALDGERDAAAVAAAVQGPPDQVAQVLAELVRVGAATAA